MTPLSSPPYTTPPYYSKGALLKSPTIEPYILEVQARQKSPKQSARFSLLVSGLCTILIPALCRILLPDVLR